MNKISTPSLKLQEKYGIDGLRISEFHFSHPKNINDTSLEKDIKFIFEKRFKRMFIRRRTMLFIESCRYAADATWKRWGVPFAFMDYGETMVKNIFQTENLNKDAGSLWWNNIKNDKHFVDKLLDEFEGIISIDLAIAKHPILRQDSWSNVELLELLNIYMSWFSQFFEIVYPWFAIDEMKKLYLDPCLRKQHPDDYDEFVSKLLRPIKLPFSSLEQDALIQLAQLKGDVFEEALIKHVAQYRSTALRDIDDQPYDTDYFRSRVKTIKKEGTKKTEDSLTLSLQEIKEADELERALDVSQEMLQLVHLIRSFAFLRTHSIDYMNIVLLAFQPMFATIAKKIDITLEELMYLTFDEIVDALGGDLMEGQSIAQERMQKPYLYLIAPGGSYLSVGEESHIFFNRIKPGIDLVTEQVSLLKGTTAFPGKVRGKVRIILDRKRSGDLKAGEVLVTPMTIPDFVPAMQRSVAIVTNEGGVLCHAAIMSRELRKPCIIATKNATDVLHDGDMVEVDADRGVVRILSNV